MTDKSDSEIFTKKTFKEVTIWDWLARILPLTVLAFVSICYFFDWTDVLGRILEVTAAIFFVFCFIWWYWAIYKIAATVKIMDDIQEGFKALKHEIKEFKDSLSTKETNDKDK